MQKAAGEWKIYREIWTASKDKSYDRTASDHKAIKELIVSWVESWENGNMEVYRSCYSPDFKARRMNLDRWISYKTGLKKRNKNISVDIGDLKISSGRNQGLAAFKQKYNSSRYNAVGTKRLRMQKVAGEWKIYREIWTANIE